MEWKQISDYENYEVSNEGDVRNKKRGQILKHGKDKDGYSRVVLCKQGKIKTYRINRLVLSTFKENPLNLPIAEHKDGNLKNNHIDNLRWATSQQNSQNKKKRENTTSKFKGVCWKKASNKWNAQITINGIQTYLGSFENEEDARKVRQKKAIELYGVFVHDCEL